MTSSVLLFGKIDDHFAFARMSEQLFQLPGVAEALRNYDLPIHLLLEREITCPKPISPDRGELCEDCKTMASAFRGSPLEHIFYLIEPIEYTGCWAHVEAPFTRLYGVAVM